MIGIETFLSVIYLLLVGTLGFVMIFPLFRDVCKDIFTPKSNANFLAFFMSLAAIGYGCWLMFYEITFFMALMLIFLSLFSGLELIYWSKAFKMNLLLFIISTMLWASSLILSQIVLIASFLKEVIWLIGVVEGTEKHLLPIIKDVYANFGGESYGEAFAALFVILCALTVLLSHFNIELPEYLKSAFEFSDILDISFLAGGLLGYLIKLIPKRKTML